MSSERTDNWIGKSIQSKAGLFLGIALLGVLTLMACGTSSGLDPAPDFEFGLYQDEDELGAHYVKLSSFRGKPVVLNFWAGLCPPCRLEMPDFQAFHEEYGDRVVVLGVDIGPFLIGLGSKEDAKELLKELDISYPTGYPPDDSAPREFAVVSMPTTFFITADGKIFRRWGGGLLNKEKLAEITEEMLALSQRAAT